MGLAWIRESPARWDDGKRRVVGGAPSGVFELHDPQDGALMPGEWWRVEQDGDVVGYGWMDIVWGDGEVLLAVDPDKQGHGVGSFIVKQLDREAAARGLNVLYNTVRPTHPEAEKVSAWLEQRGFADDGGVLKRRVTR